MVSEILSWIMSSWVGKLIVVLFFLIVVFGGRKDLGRVRAIILVGVILSMLMSYSTALARPTVYTAYLPVVYKPGEVSFYTPPVTETPEFATKDEDTVVVLPCKGQSHGYPNPNPCPVRVSGVSAPLPDPHPAPEQKGKP